MTGARRALVNRGCVFEVLQQAGEQDPQASLLLADAIARAEGDPVQRWREQVAPHLEDEWLAASGRWSTRIVATAGELAEIDAAIEAVLTPYVQRTGHRNLAPPGARGVRVLRHTMPEGPDA